MSFRLKVIRYFRFDLKAPLGLKFLSFFGGVFDPLMSCHIHETRKRPLKASNRVLGAIMYGWATLSSAGM
jgi:hypothetical protein